MSNETDKRWKLLGMVRKINLIDRRHNNDNVIGLIILQMS